MNEFVFPRGALRSAFTACGLFLTLARTAFPASPPQNFTDSDGDTYTVRLTGAGSAVVTIVDPDHDNKGPIASIALTATDFTSVLTIAVAKVGDGRVKVGAISGSGAVNIISAASCDLNGAGIALGGATLLRLGDLAAGANIVLATRPTVKPLALSARNVSAMQLTAPASTLTFAARSITGGAKFSAAQIAAFNVTAGNCAAEISTPGRLVSLSVKGGDFSGHIAARSIGSISILKDTAGSGGSLRDSTVTARAIGTVIVAHDLVNSLLLAGANLGADGILGGTGANADTFAPGTLGAVYVLGAMTNSVAGAGFTPVDGKFGDGNDGTLGGTASTLGAFVVRGQIDSLSRIGAGALPQFVYVNRGMFRPARDARFVSRKVVIPNAPVVTPLSETSVVPAAVATSFLYTGAGAVQTGVTPGAIKREAAAVLRGRVIGRDALPVPGVEVTVLDRPEFGKTNSRADGMFDMAVNGGGKLIVRLEAAGLCPLQRQIDPTRQDFNVLGDVVMIGVDPMMTEVALGAAAPMQMHEAAMQTDASGPRHAVLMFQPGTSATLLMPDGTTKPAPSLSVRATEFTVGPTGPSAMPGTLPPNSAYTYCAELTADEAVTAGATTVMFDKPVYFYVENFLHFDIGVDVPSGLYDKTKGVWEAGPSGRVIKILSITAGVANLDVNGDGNADTGGTLTALNITDAERTQLATSYTPGTSLWRVPIPHFSPWDCNWPYGPPAGAGPPNGGPPTNNNPPGDPNDPPNIFIQSQGLSETLPVAGTPFSLTYRSERVPGRNAAQRLDIPLSGATLPGPVKRIEQSVSIAGRTFSQSFAPGTNLSTSFQWDGVDAYSRPVTGRQTAKINTSYVYDGDYKSTGRFGYNGTGVLGGDRTRQEISISKQDTKVIGVINIREQAIGGWTLDVHHIYDPVDRKLYLGDGSSRSAESVSSAIETIAGSAQTYTAGFNNDNIPATSARTLRPAYIAVAADGTIYYPDASLHQIFRVGTDGIQHVIAGIATSAGYNGDERPALTAQLNEPFGIALAPDGTVYFNDGSNRRTRSITTDGMIHTVAGTGVDGYSGDGGLATAARIGVAINICYGADGSLYISDSNKHAIRRVGTDGIITTVAGNGVRGFGGDGGLATAAQLGFPLGVGLDAEGNLFIVDSENRRIRKVGTNGIITTIAGDGTGAVNATDAAGDGGPAILAKIGMARPGFVLDPNGLRVDPQGNVLFCDAGLHRVRKISRDGLITSLAGSGNAPPALGEKNGDGSAALQARFVSPTDVDFGPDGSLYLLDFSTYAVRRVAPPLAGFSGGEIAIPSADALQLYRFSGSGQHLSTVHTLTGATLYSFGYDAAGQLVSVTDGSGNITRIVRNAVGDPVAIVSPYGQRTILTTNAEGMLASVQPPIGSAHQFTYDSGGLLRSEIDAASQSYAFDYTATGLLTKHDGPGPELTTLGRVDIPDGYYVDLASVLGYSARFQIVKDVQGVETRTDTDAANLTTTDVRGADGIYTFTTPEGVVSKLTQSGDPRFGLRAPFAGKQVITSPGGRTATVNATQAATLTAPENPLSLTTLTRTIEFNGRTYSSNYTAATRTLKVATPLGRIATIKITPQGRLAQYQYAGFSGTNFTYDANGRLTGYTTGTGATARTYPVTYAANGQVASFGDGLGRKNLYTYDAAARVTNFTRPDASATLLTYDAAARVQSLTPPITPAHLFTYTVDGQLATYTAPDAGSGPAMTTFSYDAENLLQTITRPDGAPITYAPDAFGRPGTRTNGADTTTYTYAANGNLSTLTQTSGNAITLSYDGSFPIGTSWTGLVQGSVSRTLNNDFETASQSVNGGAGINFTYDADGLLTNAGALTITLDPASGFTTGTSLGGVSDTRTYTNFNELLRQTYTSNATPLIDWQYTYDRRGRISRIVETPGNSAANTFDYTYDLAGRIVSVKKNSVLVNTYTFDKNGNRLTQGGQAANYDAQDRLTDFGGVTYTYTAAGDLLTRTNGAATDSYTYDAMGNLRTATLASGNTISYVIDGKNRRIGRRVNGNLQRGYLYQDQLGIVAELDGSNNLISRFVYADREVVPSYLVKGGETFRIVSDHLGSVRLVVNVATGAIAQQLDYDAFGRILSDTQPGFQPFAFAGGLYDADTKFLRFGVRDYDPEAGRWTTRDPALFQGGDTNLYAYAFNNPVNLVDPSGLFGFVAGLEGPSAWAGAGASGGYGVSAGTGTFIGPKGVTRATFKTVDDYYTQRGAVGGGFGVNLIGISSTFTTADDAKEHASQKSFNIDAFDISIKIGYGGKNGSVSLGIGAGIGVGFGVSAPNNTTTATPSP